MIGTVTYHSDKPTGPTAGSETMDVAELLRRRLTRGGRAPHLRDAANSEHRVSDVLDRLKAALADRYAIERELGSGGMATVHRDGPSSGRSLRRPKLPFEVVCPDPEPATKPIALRFFAGHLRWCSPSRSC